MTSMTGFVGFSIQTDEFLRNWGWDPAVEGIRVGAMRPSLSAVIGRVTCERRGYYEVMTEAGEIDAEVVGKIRHASKSRADFPAVGDWVLLEKHASSKRSSIVGIVPRKTCFSRRAAGDADEEQIIAANVDLVLVVTSFTQDYSPDRADRYFTLIREAGARPVLVLNKKDLSQDPEAIVRDAVARWPELQILSVSVVSGEGLGELEKLATTGTTLALVGSSGVGKSSLSNYFLGERRMHINEVRHDDEKGRHTTTHRQLFRLPSGALLIDTPGMREVQLWDSIVGVEEQFEDILELALQCRFTNCLHQNEPGCRIKRALQSNELSAARYSSYKKIESESAARAARKKLSSKR